MRRIEVQIFDGDGIEPADVKRARLAREAAEAKEAFKRKQEEEKERYVAKAKRRALNYKESLKSHPLTVGAIKFQIENTHYGYAGKRLTILTPMPPETFNHILEIHRPKWTIRSPMSSYHHTVAEIEYPMVWIFYNPKAISYKWEQVETGAKRTDEKVYLHTLTFTCSKAQDHSARTYKNLKAIIQHAALPA